MTMPERMTLKDVFEKASSMMDEGATSTDLCKAFDDVAIETGQKKYFYYTKWKFKPERKPPDLDYGEVFHSTCTTDSPPKEFVGGVNMDDLDEYFVKQFTSEEEMESYWQKVHK